ncbi:zinc-binding dehydrogenase [Pseudoalteromonas marina]|nr:MULTISPECIES: zinc-binding dehydrogenase [Pseudoalteromonas]
MLANPATIIDEGRILPVLDNIEFNLEDAGKTHDGLASGEGMGKVVISL